MPRQSAESRAAAALREAGERPRPPRHLGKDARVLWRRIVASKSPEYFDAGAQLLLESYCFMVAYADAAHAQYVAEGGIDGPHAASWERRLHRLTMGVVRLATCLRLTLTASIDWHDRRIGERGTGTSAEDRLLGGEAVYGRRRPN